MEVKKIAVLGAGLMGHGIAQVAAQGKYDVSFRTRRQTTLDSGMAMIKDSLQRFQRKGIIKDEEVAEILGRIHPTTDLKEAVDNADVIIESIVEDIEEKKNLFSEIDKMAKPEAIIATNTSSISITELASATNRPEKFCGMHFFNPVQLMKLVEIIRGVKTSDETVETVVEVGKRMGKEPIVVKKDVPGFVVNRILVPALNEAMYLVWEGVAEPEDIDKAVRLGLNWPMGPLYLADYLGHDTTLSIMEIFEKEFGEKFRPCPILRQLVRAGLFGRKSGKGFYDWTASK